MEVYTSLTDLEIIVVDDGSTTDYSEILKEYSNVKYFKTENQGTLSARLFGISQATGDYVCFVDSDDTISFNYLETSLKNADNYDIVINDWAFHTEKVKYVCANDSTINSKIESSSPISLFFNQQGKEHSYYVLWNKIFKRDILTHVAKTIKNLNLGKTVYAEDVLMCYFAFAKANNVKNVHGGYYFYRVHSSQQVAVKSESKLKNHTLSTSQVFNIIENDLKSKNIYPTYEKDINSWKQMLCSNFYAESKAIKSVQFETVLQTAFPSCKLKRPNSSNAHAYAKHKLLPQNLEEIDLMLQQICKHSGSPSVYVKKNSYAYNELNKLKTYLNKSFTITSKSSAEFVLPKEIVPIKQKILHNYFVFKLGMFLFPKGSKIRKFLKEKF